MERAVDEVTVARSTKLAAERDLPAENEKARQHANAGALLCKR